MLTGTCKCHCERNNLFVLNQLKSPSAVNKIYTSAILVPFIFHQCANIGPAEYNYDETISTLRYANRAKNIKNKAKINEDPKDALLRQFQNEIEELKKQLAEGMFG